MNIYIVKVKPVSDTEPGAFQSFVDEIEFELIDIDEAVETYEVRSERNLSDALDASDGVVEWEDKLMKEYIKGDLL